MKKLLPKLKNNPQGFTLIELMVVISIIAFLSVIGIASFTNTQKTARDGRRRGDIDAIAKAMESNYNAVAGTYDSSFTAPSSITASFFASNGVPSDPSGGASNCFAAGSSASGAGTSSCAYVGNHVNSQKGFWVCAPLESVANGNASATGGATVSTTYPTFVTATPPNGNWYCRASQQSQ